MIPKIEGGRVWLRPMDRSDAKALAKQSHLETESGFADGRVPMSTLSFERWIIELLETERVFAVCRAGSDELIGSASVRGIDLDHRTASTGMGLFNAHDRGVGIGTEVKHLVLNWAFNDLGLKVLDCTIASTNVRSARAVERQGYQLAGRLLGTDIGAHGRLVDTLIYTIDRPLWEAAYADWRARQGDP